MDIEGIMGLKIMRDEIVTSLEFFSQDLLYYTPPYLPNSYYDTEKYQVIKFSYKLLHTPRSTGIPESKLIFHFWFQFTDFW